MAGTEPVSIYPNIDGPTTNLKLILVVRLLVFGGKDQRQVANLLGCRQRCQLNLKEF